MAQGILEKINVLISANLHAMIDRALEMNSVKVLDEYIRRADRDLDALETQIVTVGGSVRTLKRKYEELSAAAEKLDRNIDMLLTSGRTDQAARLQAELNIKQQQAQEYYQQWQSQEQEYKRMLDAKLKLEARLNTVRQEREHLQELLKLAEAKRATTRAIRSLNDIQGIGDAEIRRIGDMIRARLDREEAEMEVASMRLQDVVEETVEQDLIERQLEERRRRLGLVGSGESSSGRLSSAGSLSGTN
ncbi:MAG: PspA/IM30 family protein [Chloroflexi bacterium]|jgi:phage shock protein A|nr:PspA/IM30 family protein [Chloroflexota bacterium]